MKNLILTSIMLGTSYGYAQTNLTFQWHDQTMGVQFAMTNLTASQKITIRDDIAYSMSLIPTNHVAFEALSPTSPDYASYTGMARFYYDTPIDYCEGVLSFYKAIGGNIYWQLGEETCSNYLAVITLTNQYVTAVNSFSNFYHQVINGFDVTGMTLEEKKSFFWNATVVETLEEMEGANFEQFLTEVLSFRPGLPPPDALFPYPPILAFTVYEDEEIMGTPLPVLFCHVKRWYPDIKQTKWDFVYFNGKWRYSFLGPGF